MNILSGQEVLDYISSQVDLSYFAKQPIVNSSGQTVGYDCHVVLKSGEIQASGTGETYELAKRIAVAETLERLVMQAMKVDTDADPYRLKKVPSSSGFAAGFDRLQVRLRAVAEGFERWAWSQWIDRGHVLPKVTVQEDALSPLAKHLYAKFDRVHFYSKTFSVLVEGRTIDLAFGVTLAEKGPGIFAGSRVSSLDSDLWTHGLIEASRNLGNFTIWTSRGDLDPTAGWYSSRVKFFGMNKKKALDAAEGATLVPWPTAELDILGELPSPLPGKCFIWRCLFKDFLPWSEGPVSRFVY